jgi:cell division protein FtsB
MAAIGARPAGVLGDLDWGLRRPLRTRTGSSARGYRLRRASSRRRRAAGLSLALVVIVIAALLASLYLTQSSRIASTGYEIETLEAQLDGLEAERQALLLQIGQAQSPATIEARAASLGLVPLPGASVQFASPLSDPNQ